MLIVLEEIVMLERICLFGFFYLKKVGRLTKNCYCFREFRMHDLLISITVRILEMLFLCFLLEVNVSNIFKQTVDFNMNVNYVFIFDYLSGYFTVQIHHVKCYFHS